MSTGYRAYDKPKISFDWISESWQLVNSNAAIWVGASLITFFVGGCVSHVLNSVLHVNAAIPDSMLAHGLDPHEMIQVVPDPLTSAFAQYTNPAFAFALLIQSAVNAYFWSGMMQMANATVRGEQIDINMLFKGYSTYPAIFVIQLVISFGYMGMLIYIIPGLILYALILPALSLAAEGESIGATFSKSVQAMAPNIIMGSLFVLYGCIVGLLGMVLTCGIGALAVFPMSLVVCALACRDMIPSSDTEPHGDPSSAYPGGASQSGGWSSPGQHWQPGAQADQQTSQYTPNTGQQPSAPQQSQPGQTAVPYLPYMRGQKPASTQVDNANVQVPPGHPHGNQGDT